MLYVMMIADSFGESVREELGAIADYRIVEEQHNLLIADMELEDRSRLERAMFVYSIFPIHGVSDIDEEDYIGSIRRGIESLGLGRKTPVKLECFDINCKNGYSAKDIEVAIGQRMEEDGFNVDMVNPEVLAYAVLLNSKCYSGCVRLSESPVRFIDPFRVHKGKSISRAEFKMVEAFETFCPQAPKVAIDIGAAPGGWSLFLAKRGAAVIAIDAADLGYEKIGKLGVKVAMAYLSGKTEVQKEDILKGSILHMKCNLDKALPLLDGVKADLLADDINAGGMISARAVVRYSGLVRKGGTLIMTVKCMKRNVRKYVEEVEEILGREFEIMQWKVLPHNRQEITLFARKR